MKINPDKYHLFIHDAKENCQITVMKQMKQLAIDEVELMVQGARLLEQNLRHSDHEL